jgi:aminoglycoside phosphotransferase (APT) family kinase protein
VDYKNDEIKVHLASLRMYYILGVTLETLRSTPSNEEKPDIYFQFRKALNIVRVAKQPDPLTPSPILSTFRKYWMHDQHRIVFTHGNPDLRNIIVRDGKAVGVLRWGQSG